MKTALFALLLLWGCGGEDAPNNRVIHESRNNGAIDPLPVVGLEKPPLPSGKAESDGSWKVQYVPGPDGRYGELLWVWVDAHIPRTR